MEVNKNISNFRKSIVMFLAVLAFTTVICHYNLDQAHENAVSKITGIENETELPDGKQDRTKDRLGTLAYEAIVPLAQLSLVQELYFIADLDQLNEIETEEALETPLHFNSYFKTLFRLIISPNAP